MEGFHHNLGKYISILITLRKRYIFYITAIKKSYRFHITITLGYNDQVSGNWHAITVNRLVRWS